MPHFFLFNRGDWSSKGNLVPKHPSTSYSILPLVANMLRPLILPYVT